jgi:Fe-S oxidoreductase
MGECGHAFRSIYDVGNRWLAWDVPPFEIVHALEFYHELLTQGRITIGEKYKKKVTLHDPCNVSRGRGLHDMAREVVGMTCDDFVDMIPNREHNYCCGAGGGVVNCGPPYKTERMVNNRVKAEQLAATGAQVLIAPCHNCHSGLEDIVHHYKLDMEVKFLGDIIFETMEKKIYRPGE